MATAKKATPKKAPAKKAPAKKAPSRKAANPKVVAMKSFKVAPEPVPFRTFKITKQTVYWVLIVSIIIFSQLWILKMQFEVASLVEAQQASLQAEE